MTRKPSRDYLVGQGRTPVASRFKPGQCGNPKGRPKKKPSAADALRTAFETALSKKARITKDGASAGQITLLEAGINQLVAQFARGDRNARRDFLYFAERLGIDLTGSDRVLIDEALSPSNQAILDRFVARKTAAPDPQDRVIAPLGLLDDTDPDESRDRSNGSQEG